MDTTNEIICKKCGAIVKGDITYCPHCGELLPDKIKKTIVSEKEWERIRGERAAYKITLDHIHENGYEALTTKLLGIIEYADLKKKTDRYETISKCTFFIGLGLSVLIFLAGLYYMYRLDSEPKTGIEIVKDEATGKYGIYNHDIDSLVRPYEYDSIQYRNWVDAELYKRNYFVLFKNTLLGIADSTGTVSISCELDEIEGAYSGLIIMRENGYEGLFDTYGTPLFKTDNYHVLWEKKPTLDYFTPGTYVGNIIPVKRNTNSEWEMFNRAGKKIVNKSYPEVIQTGAPDLIKVKYNGYYGLVNTKGEEVIKCKTEKISRFKEGKAVATYYEKNVIIDLNGKEIGSFPRGHNGIWLFCEGLFAKKDLDNKIRFYNEKGESVFKKAFEQAKDGDILIDPSFQGDSARISYQGKNGYVFKDGSIKLDAK